MSADMSHSKKLSYGFTFFTFPNPTCRSLNVPDIVVDIF